MVVGTQTPLSRDPSSSSASSSSGRHSPDGDGAASAAGTPDETVDLNYDTGDRYQGYFVAQRRNGRGVYTWSSGAEYDGEWFDDDMHGCGTYTYGDGRVYEGEFRFDEMHGQGKYTFADGSVFEGRFLQDRIAGAGTYTPVGLPSSMTPSAVYWGDCAPADAPRSTFHLQARRIRHGGRVVISWPDQSAPGGAAHEVSYDGHDATYRGHLNFGRRVGRGVLKWTIARGTRGLQQVRYDGEWADDKMHGRGVILFRNSGLSYDGSFDRNTLRGAGEVSSTRDSATIVPVVWRWHERVTVDDAQASIRAALAGHQPRWFVGAPGRRELFDTSGSGSDSDSDSSGDAAAAAVAGDDNGGMPFLPGGGRITRRLAFGRVEVTYEADGDVYHGHLEGNRRNGGGVYMWSSGAKYDGAWFDDDMHGRGTYTYRDGREYEGEFRFDEMHGRGKYTFADGSVYEGEFRNDQACGSGVIISSRRRQTVELETPVELSDLLRVAQSLSSFPSRPPTQPELLDTSSSTSTSDSGSYASQPDLDVDLTNSIGDAAAGDGGGMPFLPGGGRITRRLAFGNVEVTYEADGDVYHGHLEGNRRNGKGVYMWSSGAEYDGEWFDDDMHGRGTYTYGDGREYEGEFRFDEMHGQGKYTFADGTVYEGEFRNDQACGSGVIISSRRRQTVELDSPVELADLLRVARSPASSSSLPQRPRSVSAAAPAAPAAAAAVSSSPWTCPVCTFDNDATAVRTCHMCGVERPDIPINVPDEAGGDDRGGRGTPAWFSCMQREGSDDLAHACVVCLAAPRTMALVPCGHMCVCLGCASDDALADTCPICRETFTDHVSVDIPTTDDGKLDVGCAVESCTSPNAPATHVALPCGHLTACAQCAARDTATNQCARCNGEVHDVLKVFMLPHDHHHRHR